MYDRVKKQDMKKDETPIFSLLRDPDAECCFPCPLWENWMSTFPHYHGVLSCKVYGSVCIKLRITEPKPATLEAPASVDGAFAGKIGHLIVCRRRAITG